MKFTFKNPFAVKESDTVGDAVIKGMTEGYIKGVASAGVGVGAIVLLIKAFSKKGNSKKKEEVKELTEEEVEKAINEESADSI